MSKDFHAEKEDLIVLHCAAVNQQPRQGINVSSLIKKFDSCP